MSCIRISEAGFLAFNALAILASTNEIMNADRISSLTGSSRFHLSKVMMRLHKSDLVKSLRGPKGGFTLARPAEEITLLEIYELMEGPIKDKECPFDREKCPFDICLMGDIMHKITAQFKNYLGSTSLANFVSKKENRK